MNIKPPKPKDLPALKQLWLQAFGDSEAFMESFFREAFREDRCRCLYRDDFPAAALYWFDCRWQDKPVAYIYGVATNQQFQKQGLCRALMEDTHRHLALLGYAGAVLVPSSQGLFSLYEKLGYRSFCPMERRTVAPTPGQTLALRAIAPGEYAALRPQFLPENSILQGEDALSFVSSFARFYAGEKLLFCAGQEGDTLYFQEYFGNADLLGQIVYTLGAGKGIVRLPGKGPDFAMYRSLDKDTTLPQYFGIAMD